MTLQRCPLCDYANQPAVPRCRCGHAFDADTDAALAVLREHRAHMQILLGARLALSAVFAAGMLYVSPFFAIGLGLSLLFTAHTGRRLSIAGAGVRQLEARRLPRAVLRKGLPRGEPTPE